ncbi:MAG: 50S ribosomal protein L23 [Simkania sp.]|nr:50S ribosomal protein L23 [Simkania sp.]
MLKKTPYDIIKNRHVTEKARVLEQLQYNSSNACVKKCDAPKAVFIVNRKSNKIEIAQAVEQIYIDKKVKVVKVNIVNVKSKTRRVRGRIGVMSAFKKAIVTFRPGDSIDEKV